MRGSWPISKEIGNISIDPCCNNAHTTSLVYILRLVMHHAAYLLIPWKGMVNKPFKFRVATDRSAIRWKTYCSSS